jgi:hypothetical protein
MMTDTDQLTTLVNSVMNKYNAVLAEVVKAAQAQC